MGGPKSELVGLTADNKRLKAALIRADARHEFNTAKARANAVRVVELENERAVLLARVAELETALEQIGEHA